MTEQPSDQRLGPYETQLGAPPQAYQHPQAQPAWTYAPRARTNGVAIASMILGILWLYWLGSVLALILGYVALRQIKNAPAHEPQDGRGMAIAGIVLGWVGVGVLVLIFAFFTFMNIRATS